MSRIRVVVVVVSLLFIALVSFAQTPAPADAYKPVLDRLQAMGTVPLAEWRWHDDTLPHPESPSEDDAQWQTIKVGDKWDTGPRWFRRVIEIPTSVGGYNTAGSRVKLDLGWTWSTDIKVRVFFNGSMVAVSDFEMDPVLITNDAQPGQKVLIAFEIIGPKKPARIERAALLFEPQGTRPDPTILRQEILSAAPLISAFPDGLAERQKHLDAAVAAIDVSAIDKGDNAAIERSLAAAQEKLAPLATWEKEKFAIRAMGNSHIDMAWLWPWTETVEVVRNTFGTALQLMRQYPDFRYTQSQARAYLWMEEKYPELFKEIQERVKTGQWEIVGGMWVEPDLNLPDGEALVRQVMIGKRYFREKFGVDVRIGYNPDSFGYNWQLPQIYKKSGMDYFVTQKIYWNDTTKFPHKLFWWEAPDGSRVLTYFPHDYANDTNPVKMATDAASYIPAMNHPEMGHLYGVGDHGGGPTRGMIDQVKRWQDPKLAYPKVYFGSLQGFFDGLGKNVESITAPTWKDELYLEYHRGTQTTQSETKKRNRESEVAMLSAEKYASMAMLNGKSYPQVVLNDAWKKVLFNQFHDILPGSGVAALYTDAARDHEDAQRAAREIARASLEEVAAHANTSGAGAPVVVFNPLSWERSEMVEFTVELPMTPKFGLDVMDDAGKLLYSEIIGKDEATHRYTLRALASVPPMGYAVLHVNAPKAAVSRKAPLPRLTVKGTTLENEFLRVAVDPKSGCITSLFDKKSGKEALAQGGCGNLLQAFVDKPKRWDAWNVDADFEDKKWDLDKAEEVKLVENTATRAAIRVTKKFQSSTFVQDITLAAASPRVDVRTVADWHEKHILIKAAFPASVESKFATYEIPYGSIQRPTTRNTPEEKAKFEVPALRWADLSDSNHGFSLLNASKYGYDTKDNVIRLSLLRSPEYPDPHADEGRHEFTYSLYPHSATWREAMTVRRGYELNYPLTAFATTSHAGALGVRHSFVTVDADNVVLTAVKKAEDDDGLILRFYEWAGKKADVHVSVPGHDSLHVAETNLIEDAKNASPSGPSVTVPTNPYEIKALKVLFK